MAANRKRSRQTTSSASRTTPKPRPKKSSRTEKTSRRQPERLQKLLASLGHGSRREIEGWIREGRLKVNGKPAELGQRATPSDQFTLDGKPLKTAQAREAATEVIVYRKPVGELVTKSDPEGRPTIFANLPKPKTGRWIAVGRLDINTAGLLLLTNDGELANALMHPSQEVEREYAVRVLGEVTERHRKTLLRGVELEDGLARFDALIEQPGRENAANCWFHVTVREGRNRLVRRLWESQGFEVSRLVRLRYGPVSLPRGLKTGSAQPLSGEQIAALRQAAGLN